jgi:hypothetical protein
VIFVVRELVACSVISSIFSITCPRRRWNAEGAILHGTRLNTYPVDLDGQEDRP